MKKLIKVVEGTMVFQRNSNAADVRCMLEGQVVEKDFQVTIRKDYTGSNPDTHESTYETKVILPEVLREAASIAGFELDCHEVLERYQEKTKERDEAKAKEELENWWKYYDTNPLHKLVALSGTSGMAIAIESREEFLRQKNRYWLCATFSKEGCKETVSVRHEDGKFTASLQHSRRRWSKVESVIKAVSEEIDYIVAQNARNVTEGNRVRQAVDALKGALGKESFTKCEYSEQYLVAHDKDSINGRPVEMKIRPLNETTCVVEGTLPLAKLARLVALLKAEL